MEKSVFSISQESDLPPDKPAKIQDIESIVSQMTLDEKIQQLGGDSVLTTPGLQRLNIPPFNMSDGPSGISKYKGKATCFPSTLSLASTWDTALTFKMAEALAKEFKDQGILVALAPCINLVRDPRWGRSFESMGEDPFLASAIASHYIEGVQSQKVIAILKHLACNNQENGRHSDNVAVSEQILHDIYLRHFHDCVKQAKPWAIMSAYNQTNGMFCSENKALLREIVKENWQFEGFIVSDWGACHSAKESIEAGLDIEMPAPVGYYNEKLAELVRNGDVDIRLIDDAVSRILAAKLWMQSAEPISSDQSNDNHSEINLEIAENACVLLKNESNVLPITGSPKKIAVIGPLADAASPSGGGSGEVDPFYTVSILDGLINHNSDKHHLSFAKGCFLNPDQCRLADEDFAIRHDSHKPGFKAEFYGNEVFSGTPLQTMPEEKISHCWYPDTSEFGNIRSGFSARWAGVLQLKNPGRFVLCAIANGTVRMLIDDQVVFESAQRLEQPVPQYTEISLFADKPYEIMIEYQAAGGFKYEIEFFIADFDRENRMVEARALAGESEISILCLGTDRFTESEAFDRNSLALPQEQLDLLRTVSEVSRNTVVILQTGSIVLMDWHRQVQGILQGWYNGQESGNAIAKIIFGKFNPCGKLPISIPEKEADLSPYDNNYDRFGGAIGYRYYEVAGIKPLYAFGYGLSYSQFEYSDIGLQQLSTDFKRELLVSFTLANTGDLDGSEIVQLYIRRLDQAVQYKDLRSFKKVGVKAKSSVKVQFVLTDHDLAYYNPRKKDYSELAEKYSILIGRSSLDIRLEREWEISNAQ